MDRRYEIGDMRYEICFKFQFIEVLEGAVMNALTGIGILQMPGKRIATTSLRTGLAMTCKVRKMQQLPHYHVIARAIARGNPFPAMQSIALAVRPIQTPR